MHTCTYRYTYEHMHMYTYIHVCMHMYLHTNMYIQCTCVSTIVAGLPQYNDRGYAEQFSHAFKLHVPHGGGGLHFV